MDDKLRKGLFAQIRRLEAENKTLRCEIKALRDSLSGLSDTCATEKEQLAEA